MIRLLSPLPIHPKLAEMRDSYNHSRIRFNQLDVFRSWVPKLIQFSKKDFGRKLINSFREVPHNPKSTETN